MIFFHLKIKMTSVVEESDEIMAPDPTIEIMKLQELVKKLEVENQLLLQRHNENVDEMSPPLPGQVLGSPTISPVSNGFKGNGGQILRQLNGLNNSMSISGNTVADNEFSTGKLSANVDRNTTELNNRKPNLDSVVLIDIDQMSLDDDCNWLYQSPKQTPSAETFKSPFQWVREEFDDPVQKSVSFQKSLCHKLDEVTKCSKSPWQPKVASSFGCTDATSHKASPAVPNSKEDFGDVIEVIKVSPMRKISPDPTKSSVSQTTLNKPSSCSDVAEDISKQRAFSTSTSDELMFGSGYKLTDVSDVQVLAKLQEQSLRMSYNSPLASAKKRKHAVLSKSLNRSSGALADGEIDSRASLFREKTALSKEMNQSTGALTSENEKQFVPGKFIGSTSKSAVNLTSSLNGYQESGLVMPKTGCNSLPESPYNSHLELSQGALVAESNAVPHQQSLPNLTKTLPLSVLRSHPSEPHLTSPSSKKTLSLLRQPTPSRTSSQPTLSSPLKPLTTRTASSQFVSRSIAPAPVRAGPLQTSKNSRSVNSVASPIIKGNATNSASKPTTNAVNRPANIRSIASVNRPQAGSGGRSMASASGSTSRLTNLAATPTNAARPSNSTPGTNVRPATLPTNFSGRTNASTTGGKGNVSFTSNNRGNRTPLTPSSRNIPTPLTPNTKIIPTSAGASKIKCNSLPKRGTAPPSKMSPTHGLQNCSFSAATTNNDDDDDWKEGCF